MSTLDDLQTRGLIEAVEPDQATATGWLAVRTSGHCVAVA